jgi:hypothetical protein
MNDTKKVYNGFMPITLKLCEGCNVSAALTGCSIKAMEMQDECPCQECLIKASCSKQCRKRVNVRSKGILNE